MWQPIERTARPSGPGIEAAIGLGLATGLRSFLGAAALATRPGQSSGGGLQAAVRRRLPPRETPGPIGAALRTAPVRHGLQALAAGELIADKLPGIPDRTDTGPLVARALIGATLGWVVARSGARPVAALAGGCAAIAAAFAGNRLRRALTHRAGLPDALVAVTEDALAVGLATAAVRPRR